MKREQENMREEIDNLIIDSRRADDPAAELVITLDGSIDSYNSQEFETIMKKLMASWQGVMVFECGLLNYISSMGIGIFMNMLSAVKKTNGSIIFENVQKPVKKVFDNLGFSIFFTFRDKTVEKQ
jgi:anti-sigma B factor antagonist